MENVQMILGALQEFQQYTTKRLDKMEVKIDATLRQAIKTNGRVDILDLAEAKRGEEKKKKIDWKDKVKLLLIGSFITLACGFVLNLILKIIH